MQRGCYVTTQCLSPTLIVHFQDIVLAKHGWTFARIMPKGKTTVQQRDSFSTGLEINQPYYKLMGGGVNFETGLAGESWAKSIDITNLGLWSFT